MGTYIVLLKTVLEKTYWDKNLNKEKRVQRYAPPQPNTISSSKISKLKHSNTLHVLLEN